MKLVDWTEYVSKPEEHTVSGAMKIIESFPMHEFQRQRRIWIYLPPGYEKIEERFPVLYMHDGQNLFDALTSYSGEWQIDESINHLCAKQITKGAIVVGIDNGGETRFDEYIPSYNGDKYLDFIVNNLKPYIDRAFRTQPGREHTGLAGSSLGGLISLYMGLKRPDVFSKLGVFSPAMSFAGDSFKDFGKKYDMKIYLDVGTKESLPYDSSRKYADLVWNTYYHLLDKGFRNDEVQFLVEKDAGHNEEAWARRFPNAFLWLFDAQGE